MGAFNKVTKESIDNIQINAGVILNDFNPENPVKPTATSIITATTGGIQARCIPTFEDFGADIDNCPNNTMEMKKITGYDCTLTFTALDINSATIKLGLGAATEFSKEIKARELNNADFADIWFVSERVDGKIIAILLKNGLSTGGFDYKTQKNGKGQMTITITGHVSIDDADEVPMEFYICDNVKSGTSALTVDYDE